MATKLPNPPGVSDSNNFRARESFDRAIFDAFKLVGSVTTDVGSIASGATASFTVTVTGCRADEGQTVQVGLPSAMNSGLVVWGNVTADNTVTVYLYNRTGGAIDPVSATYKVRVMP